MPGHRRLVRLFLRSFLPTLALLCGAQAPDPEVARLELVARGPFYVGQPIPLRLSKPCVHRLPVLGVVRVAGGRLLQAADAIVLVPEHFGNIDIKIQSIKCDGHEIRVAPLSVKVEPIPVAGRTREFAGGVGALSAAISPAHVRTPLGKSLTYVLRLEGPGAFGIDQAPTIHPPDAFELRGTRNVLDASQQVRTIEFEMRALKAGSWTIPPLAIATFRPETRRFETMRTPPMRVEVMPAERLDVSRVQYAEPAQGRSTRWLWIVTILGLSGVVVAVFVSRSVLAWRSARDASRRGRRQALSRLRSLHVSTPRHAAEQIEHILAEFLALGLATPTPAEAADVMRALGASDETADAAHSLLERCAWWLCSEEGLRVGEVPDPVACRALIQTAKRVVRAAQIRMRQPQHLVRSDEQDRRAQNPPA